MLILYHLDRFGLLCRVLTTAAEVLFVVQYDVVLLMLPQRPG